MEGKLAMIKRIRKLYKMSNAWTETKEMLGKKETCQRVC